MTLSHRFEEALQYAVQAHTGQLRKGTSIPYISHLLMVTAIALEHGADEDEAIAALLHDAVEDAGGEARRRDIESRFGSRVADIVQGCTDADGVPKPPWKNRKQDYLSHLEAEQNESVLLVSAADKVANVRSILNDYRQLGEALWPRFNGGREGSLWYYRALADLFSQKRPRPLVDELNRLVYELETLARADSSASINEDYKS